jgi:hypothetical protein
MTTKQALTIAYSILNDELSTQDENYGYESADDCYYEEITEAIHIIHDLINSPRISAN